MKYRQRFFFLLVTLLLASLSCQAVLAPWPWSATPTPLPSATLSPTLRPTPSPSATRTLTPTPTETPTPTPTEGPVGEFLIGEIAALDYPRANWQDQQGALLHRSLPDCAITMGGGTEGLMDIVVQIGGFRWLNYLPNAYALQGSGEAYVVMQLGKKPTACKKAIQDLMKTVHEYSVYAQSGICRYAPAQRLKVGNTAIVVSSSYLRTKPLWAEDTRIRLVSPAEKLTLQITGGPVCVIYDKGEYSYWQVELSSGEKGWVAEGDLKEYYLALKK